MGYSIAIDVKTKYRELIEDFRAFVSQFLVTTDVL